MTEVKNFGPEVKGKILLLDILKRIDQGQSIKDIYESYGWSKQRLNPYINKLKNAGYIRLKLRSTVAVYELTAMGKGFYTEYASKLGSGIRLHNVSFKYELLSGAEIEADKVWQINGLSNRLIKESDASIVIHNNKSVTVNIGSLMGNSAFELEDKAKNIADNIKRILSERYGLQLSEGRLSRKPHYAMINPIFEQVTKHIEFSSDIAKSDRSEGDGEIEFFSPEKVDAFLRMPDSMAQVMQVVDQIKKDNEVFRQIIVEMSKTERLNSVALVKIMEALGK